MADADSAKSKAEKLAAARKKVEETKKKNAAKKVGAAKEKAEAVPEDLKAEEQPEPEKEAVPEETAVEDVKMENKAEESNEPKDEEETVSYLNASKSHQRQPSIPLQSKIRSSSFRESTGPLSPNFGFSPEGDTAPDIYRKQALRIDELEKENKRLSKDASDGEKRWKKAEEVLDILREAEGESTSKAVDASVTPNSSGESEKLKTEIAALQRQNTQLQARSRHGSSPSVSNSAIPSDLEASLLSKSSTIESMEIAISTLRAQLERISSGSSVEKKQIAALEDKLSRSERSAATAQRELTDLKKNLEGTTEKAVKEGSERTSAETKLRTLEREAEDARQRSEELQRKVEGLEKKANTLATLHKEHDVRSQAMKREREKAEKEAVELGSKLEGVEKENQKLKEERERARMGGDDGVEELENEERLKLEKKVRDLEGEVHELRRGIYNRERGRGEEDNLTSPEVGNKFTDVDLGGGGYTSPNGRRSVHAGGGKGIGDFLASGFNAITGANSVGAGSGMEKDGLLDDEGDMEFDEDAFRRAQEEEAKKRIERVKEVKRGLKNWEGWRLDLVEERRAGDEGVGEIFEV